MYSKHPCVPDDPYQLAYEHGRQLEFAVHLGSSAEVSLDKLEHGKYQVSDGEKEHFEATSVADMEFKKRIANIPMGDAAKSTQGTEASENGKRPANIVCGELVNKRAKKEDQTGKLEHFAGNSNSPINITFEEKTFSEEPEWKMAASVVNANGESPAAATNLLSPGATCNASKVDTRQGQPAGLSFFPGYEYLHRAGLDLLEDVHSPLSEHSHRRLVPIGLDHQADLPQWTPKDFGFSAAHSARSNVTPTLPVIESNEVSADKWLGICVIPLPRLHSSSVETHLCCPKQDCACGDEGSIRCVSYHVMEARKKLKGALGNKKFMELGFPDMGEDVAQRWTEEEENLFHMIVLSNSASLGRNFWTLLPHSFPSRSFKEIVSYYFNVFILRKRADQNRMDPLNVDSDNDEWQESSDGEFAMSEEEEEEEDSVVESPNDASEDLDFDDEVDDEEYQKHLVATEDEGFYCGSVGSTGFKSKSPCKQPIDRSSRDCSLDQDVQDDSCTSFEGPCNASDSCVERDQENLHKDHRSNCMVGFADYEFIDGHHDSKPWDINYIRANEKEFDFFPTCNVLEEVFGKGV
ncbi:hypothetical protein KFK09_005906 [Dendrobium nobile]|uniref:Myb-like domain-containing protein n=1 Tax=Dendrobium nobile TaxID=94219 RepID=A0A8T3BZJ5_DENNO|nr:hypothetical protein KFK09_005906 [Dendrobium nobile]